MYCIRRGLVEVIGDDDTTVVATLGPGAYFGEVRKGFIALLPSYNCNFIIIISKANKMLDIIYRTCSTDRDQKTLLILYKLLVLPQLEYACQVWSPYT